MSAYLPGYERAQRHFDAMSAPELDDVPVEPFQAELDTSRLIRDLAACQHHSAWMWFEDEGLADFVGERLWFGSADILRNLCRAWLKDPEVVHAACGTEFWQSMKDLAAERWARSSQ